MAQKADTVRKKVCRLTERESKVIDFLRSSDQTMLDGALSSLKNSASAVPYLDVAVDLLSAYKGEDNSTTINDLVMEMLISRGDFNYLLDRLSQGKNIILAGNVDNSSRMLQALLLALPTDKDKLVFIQKAKLQSDLDSIVYAKNYLSSDNGSSFYDNVYFHMNPDYSFLHVTEKASSVADAVKMLQMNMAGIPTVTLFDGDFLVDWLEDLDVQKSLPRSLWQRGIDLEYEVVLTNAKSQYYTKTIQKTVSTLEEAK